MLESRRVPEAVIVATILVAGSSCAGAPAGRTPSDRTIVPGRRAGAIAKSTTEADLRAAVGPDSLRPGPVHVAEGFCGTGTTVYPGSTDSVVVIWTSDERRRPAEVRIYGAGSAWRTPAGVGIGTTVAELEALSGRPVTFYGFEWGGSGLGRWTEDVGGVPDTVFFRVYPDTASIRRFGTDPRYDTELIGDVRVSSDHPLVRQMTLPIRELSLRWARPATFECPDSLLSNLR
jgi:hypothetical protein